MAQLRQGQVEKIAILENRSVRPMKAGLPGFEESQRLRDGENLVQGPGVPAPVNPPHELLGPAVLVLKHGVDEMDNTAGLEAVMELDKKALEQLVVEVVGRSGEEDLVEVALGEGTSSEIGDEELHVRPVMEAFFGGIDRDRVEVDSVILELAERGAQVAARTAEIEQSARCSESRSIKLALEFGRSKNALDERPEPRE
jgi:hypothetical protein